MRVPTGDPEQTDASQAALVCAECGATSPPGARGWQALLGYDPRRDEWPETFVFSVLKAQVWPLTIPTLRHIERSKGRSIHA
jgi:hypothetical protein